MHHLPGLPASLPGRYRPPGAAAMRVQSKFSQGPGAPPEPGSLCAPDKALPYWRKKRGSRFESPFSSGSSGPGTPCVAFPGAGSECLIRPRPACLTAMDGGNAGFAGRKNLPWPVDHFLGNNPTASSALASAVINSFLAIPGATAECLIRFRPGRPWPVDHFLGNNPTASSAHIRAVTNVVTAIHGETSSCSIWVRPGPPWPVE